MKFKQFLYEAEGREFHEGPRGRKVGEFLGGMAGLAGPALGGAAISGEMMGGDMFDKHGAPGGLLGTGLGVMKGRHWGSAIGGAIGDKVGDGIGWLGRKLFGPRKKKGDPNAYFKKLQGDRDLGADPETDVDYKPQGRVSGPAVNPSKEAEAHLKSREGLDAAAKTLGLILGDKELDLGYSPDEIRQFVTNIGDNNRVLRAWKLHGYDKMIEDSLAKGQPATARMMGKRAVAELQKARVLPHPAGRPPYEVLPDDDHGTPPTDGPGGSEIDLADHPDAHEPEAGDATQPSVKRRVDLFGDEVPDAPKKKKRAPSAKPRKPRGKKKADTTPGLFDGPEPGSLF